MHIWVICVFFAFFVWNLFVLGVFLAFRTRFIYDFSPWIMLRVTSILYGMTLELFSIRTHSLEIAFGFSKTYYMGAISELVFFVLSVADLHFVVLSSEAVYWKWFRSFTLLCLKHNILDICFHAFPLRRFGIYVCSTLIITTTSDYAVLIFLQEHSVSIISLISQL